MTYRRRSSPLHAARATAGAAYCGALGALAVLTEHPVVLAAILVAVVVAGRAAGVADALARAARLGVALALVFVVVNPIVSSNGSSVLVRGGTVPVLGSLDVTLEAVAYGGVLGLRALVIILAFALYSAAVDPDEILRLFRRISFRSALTAALANRMVPVLARDGRRLAEAQRCRPGRPASRLALVRSVAAGALDRSVDVAATLELRGYGITRRPSRESSPWSRQDAAFAAAAGGLVAAGVLALVLGAARFEAYPRLDVSVGMPELALAVAVIALAAMPFADRRGVAR
jgi:energy-coupling factor transport system permease protein